MANPEHLKVFKQGVQAWNQWRKDNTKIQPDLMSVHESSRDLIGIDLRGANLCDTYLFAMNLNNANLAGANLLRAEYDNVDLSGANLSHAYLASSILTGVNFNNADLSYADLNGARMISTSLHSANLYACNLLFANFGDAILTNADLTDARIGWTTFGENDLSTVKGLETVYHSGPSPISLLTIYRSGGCIAENFLYGTGIPNNFITYLDSLVSEGINYYSCFISYSTKDEEFVNRLRSRMRDAKLRVWFAPEDMKGGKKIHEQIERAIELHDRLLIVLSENSLQSEWVMTEIRKARKAEIREKRRKLFPIRLVDFDIIREWECFDADTGKDLAVEVREYYIPDFSNWKDHDSFEATFDKLLQDLKAEEEN
jgi:uncharacterized protein YjbI with pentapeptide repeats